VAEDFSSTLCFQTGPGAHPASYTTGTGGSFPGGKARPGRDADHSPLPVPRLRNSRSYTSSHPNAPLWSVTGPLYHLSSFASKSSKPQRLNTETMFNFALTRRRKDVWTGGKVLLDTRRRSMLSFTLRPLCPQYPLGRSLGGRHSTFWHIYKEKHIFFWSSEFHVL
jgi:hypothetical protein